MRGSLCEKERNVACSTPRHHDCGAGTLCLGKVPGRGHRMSSFSVSPRIIGTIEVRLLKRILQATPSGATTMAGVAKLARLARIGKDRASRKGAEFQSPSIPSYQILKGLARSRPINAGLSRAARSYAHRADAASARSRRQSGHRSHQRLADRNHVRFRKQPHETPPNILRMSAHKCPTAPPDTRSHAREHQTVWLLARPPPDASSSPSS